ncbi:MAG: DUF6323 family protein [Cellulosilyticaceae bacterium]
MDEKNWMILLGDNNQLQKVVVTNEYTKKFGVSLSETDAKQLLAERKETLKLEERIEFGEGILSKLIFAFCDSPYIYQDNYVETIGRLQEIFYLYKNESLDELTDDELIDFMKKAFNGICEGSLDYLEETSLEKLARDIRCEGK